MVFCQLGFREIWEICVNQMALALWPASMQQALHVQPCLRQQCCGMAAWQGGGFLGEEPDCTTGPLYCRKPEMFLHNWHIGEGGLHKVFPCQHKAQPRASRSCSYPGLVCQLCLCVLQSRMQSNRLDWGIKQWGQSRAKPSTTPRLPQDKRSASQGWKLGAGAFWGCGGATSDASLQKHH